VKIVKEYAKIIIVITLLMIFLSVSIPLLLQHVFYSSFISNGELASFLGSFLGGIIGGGITLITMYISIKEARKDLRRDERVKNRSYIDTFAKKAKYGTLSEYRDYYKEAKVIMDDRYMDILKNPAIIAKNKGILFIGIENCGPGIIKELKVEMINDNKKVKNFFINRVLVSEIFFIPVVFNDFADIGCSVKKVTLMYRTLSNEIVVISKMFEKNNRYAEKIDVYEKFDYRYESQQCKWTDIESLD